MNYQETWIRGRPTGEPSQRPCAPRYAMIEGFLQNYNRKFSLFDLGANLGYFSFRAAEDFDATCIMVDNRPDLAPLLRQNRGLNTVWLNARLSPDQLAALTMCESFDVALALSVLHHFGDQWLLVLAALRRMADWVIVEIPAADDEGSVNGHLGGPMREHIEAIEGVELLMEFPSHKSGRMRPMFLIPGTQPKKLEWQTIDAPHRKVKKLRNVEIQSDFDQKRVLIQRDPSVVTKKAPGGEGGATGEVYEHQDEERDFIPGMNLWNFIQLNGTYPVDPANMLIRKASAMDPPHDDLRPWNFILDGQELHPIDNGSKWWKNPKFGEKDLETTVNLIRHAQRA